jgi:uncharacterized protein (DUF2141 family)
MKTNWLIFSLVITGLAFTAMAGITGCAQIGIPTGGPKDSIAPVLINAFPPEKTTNFKGNKITLNFDEYIDVQEIQNNVLVSPFPKSNPVVSFKLKTLTVKLKDTLKENTTYAINFGNAIRDLNEGNPYKNYTYVFSTGNRIDSLKLSGRIILAETGRTDSTLVAILYIDAPDSAVQNRKPDYLAKADGKGEFTFINLSPGKYKLYALKDGDGGKTYNSKIEAFAFCDSDITIADSTSPVTLYAFEEEKDKKTLPVNAPAKSTIEKKLKFNTSLQFNFQDLLSNLEILFNRPLKLFDNSKIILTDSNFKKIEPVSYLLDSTKKNITIKTRWAEEFDYRLIINKEVVTDTLNTQLAKTDTIRFKSKKQSDYGSLLIRFTNLKKETYPVLQFFRGDELKKSVPVTSATWSDKLMEPGEYELRILLDNNNNGKWDPGNYLKRIQPEKAITLDKKLQIKANWDNEREVEL